MIDAAVLHGLGQTPRYELFPAPGAGEGEAVVTVAAAALKPSDRLMADGVHYAPTGFPQVVGLDGVGRLSDGRRVAFMIPPPPYGGAAIRVDRPAEELAAAIAAAGPYDLIVDYLWGPPAAEQAGRPSSRMPHPRTRACCGRSAPARSSSTLTPSLSRRWRRRGRGPAASAAWSTCREQGRIIEEDRELLGDL